METPMSRRIIPSVAALALLVCVVAATGAEPAASIACWRGPTGSGACPDSGRPMIDDLSKAKALWISEDRGCSIGYGADGVGKDGYVNFRSGYASPVAVDGRVYFAYFAPTGWDPKPGPNFTDQDRARAKQLAESYVGDDVVLCADAQTGKTVWRQTFKGNAIHWRGLSKYGTHATPCVADGKVFALGSCGGIYAMDARTGRVLWQGTVGDAYAKHKTGRDAGQPPGGRYHFSSCPTWAEGVAVFNDHSGSLLGLDGATGKELWRTKGAAGSCTSPIRWPCGDRTYILAHGKCLDPRTGKIIWKAESGIMGGAQGTYPVSGQYMVTTGGHGTKPPKDEDADDKAPAADAPKSLTGVTCFKIDEKGATKLWSLEARYGTGHSAPLIYRDYVYFQTGTQLVCAELKTGRIVAERAVTNSNPCQAPIACDGRIIMMSRAGVLLFTEGSDGMKPLGSPLSPPRESTITPYVADGRLFFRGPNYLYCYDLRKG
jgi:outer membrane protein assembly factor BamB